MLTIGQVAKISGVAAKTIRYYEDIGLLPAPRRTASGYRQYDDSAVERLRFIGRARSLRLPLQRLRALTASLNGGPDPVLRPQLLALVGEQLVAVQAQIAELTALRQQLERVSLRIRTSTRQHHTGTCRCLETDDTARGHSPRRAHRRR